MGDATPPVSAPPKTGEAAAEAPPPTTTTQRRIEKDGTEQELLRLALHKSPFFTCMDDEQVERFIEVAELKRYVSGQSIILEGCVDDAKVDQQAEDSQLLLLQQSSTGPHIIPGGKHLDVVDEDNDTKITDFQDNDEGFIIVEMPTSLSGPTSGEGHNHGGRSNDLSNVESGKSQGLLNTSSDDKELEEAPGSSNELAPQFSELESTTIPPSPRDDPTSNLYLAPPPPKSGVPSYIYIIRTGQADVMYSKNSVNPASLGTGTVFGEGGFLFGRQHSASVLAAKGVLECYVVDATTFRNYVLPSENMTKLYNMHATHVDDESNSKFMTMQDFITSCLGRGEDDPSSSAKGDNIQLEGGDDEENASIQDPLASVRIANTFNILSNDKGKGATMYTQRISIADFCLFHLLMARPDPEVDITFLLIDVQKRGVLYKDDIASFLKSSVDDFVFDMNSQFIHRHFGKDNSHQQQHRGIRPHQFSQFLVDLRREIGQQVFLQEVERNGTTEGYLPPSNFVRILKTACGWRLPDGVADRLGTIYQTKNDESVENEADPTSMEGSNVLKGSQYSYSGYNTKQGSFSQDSDANEHRLGDHYFSYCDFLAYQEVLSQLPGICNLIDRACEIKKGPLSPDDFKVANRVLGMGGSLSRRQVGIIFQLFDLDDDGYVSHEDTVTVAGVEVAQRIDAVAGRQGALTFAPPPRFRHGAQAEEPKTESFGVLLQNFSLTSIAGAIGVIALAPLDLVKTRLMNERIAINGKRMYDNSYRCLALAARSEGFFGLYRGLLPQLIGVAPEKAIKLVVNDLVHQSLGTPESGPNKSAIQFLQEMLAGGCAGACQLLVTNPIDVVKVRMQLQGETVRLLKARGFEHPVPQSLQAVVRTLGYSGMFTAARACLLRDVPFGAIYFPTYSFIKENLSAQDGRRNSISAANLLLAGTLAGIPASLLTTPADVIKTRLMVVPRPGEQSYNGIRDCFTKIYEREGKIAFFRGAAMRVARISPQFGISLVAYEQLSQLLGAQGFLPPTGVPVDPRDYWGAFPTRASINQKTNDTDKLLKNLGSKSLKPGGDRS